MKVQDGSLVAMNYRLFDVKNALVESTEEEGPVTYRHGNGEILPGLEKALSGQEAGGSLRVTVAPEEAYGMYNPEGLVSVPRADLPAEHEYVPGEWISVTVEDDEHESTDEEHEPDNEMEMRIVEVHEEEIVLDANHELAGQPVTFEVEILSVD